MGKRNTVEEVVETTPEVEEVSATKEEAVAPKGDKDEVIVTWRLGTRTYSKEVHGADFRKLAKEFAEKFEGTIA